MNNVKNSLLIAIITSNVFFPLSRCISCRRDAAGILVCTVQMHKDVSVAREMRRREMFAWKQSHMFPFRKWRQTYWRTCVTYIFSFVQFVQSGCTVHTIHKIHRPNESQSVYFTGLFHTQSFSHILDLHLPCTFIFICQLQSVLSCFKVFPFHITSLTLSAEFNSSPFYQCGRDPMSCWFGGVSARPLCALFEYDTVKVSENAEIDKIRMEAQHKHYLWVLCVMHANDHSFRSSMWHMCPEMNEKCFDIGFGGAGLPLHPLRIFPLVQAPRVDAEE